MAQITGRAPRTLRHPLRATACLNLNPAQAAFEIEHGALGQLLRRQAGSAAGENQTGGHQMLSRFAGFEAIDGFTGHAMAAPRILATRSKVRPFVSRLTGLLVKS